jgi:hypothetical protein
MLPVWGVLVEFLLSLAKAELSGLGYFGVGFLGLLFMYNDAVAQITLGEGS